jgi:hypothetical protein
MFAKIDSILNKIPLEFKLYTQLKKDDKIYKNIKGILCKYKHNMSIFCLNKNYTNKYGILFRHDYEYLRF